VKRALIDSSMGSGYRSSDSGIEVEYTPKQLKIKPLNDVRLVLRYHSAHNSLSKHSNLTSIPTCRKTLGAENIERYFDFKHPKLYIYIEVFP
jgi:hypothetical protein